MNKESTVKNRGPVISERPKKRKSKIPDEDVFYQTPAVTNKLQRKNKKRVSDWNYRVMAVTNEINDEIYFRIHEVYYKKGIPNGYTVEAAVVGGDTIEVIQWSIKKLNEATLKPVLWYGEKFPGEYKP